MHTRPLRRSWPLAIAVSGVLVLSGCADFADEAAGEQWSAAPELTPEQGPQPELPEAATPDVPSTPQQEQTEVPPPEGCTDYDEAVIATCLDTVSAVAAMPSDGQVVSALAGERKSGRVLLVDSNGQEDEYAKLNVDASGDGGLMGLALSPTYAEDRLVYAYITTGEDNRVVRFAQGQPPKPVLTGIPKGEDGNAGALLASPDGSLLVATGNAGDPGQSRQPRSLAGKVLRIDGSGQPVDGDSRVVASGMSQPGGLCQTADGSRTWVTDRTADEDALYRLPDDADGGELTAVWTWPDKPGVTGCTDWSDSVAVGTESDANVQNLPLTQDGAVGGEPQVTMDGENGPSYGRIGALTQASADVAIAGTVNKDGGEPVSSDDRVVLIVRQPAGGSGRD
ncbi:glucose dehydrogenase [Saccharomonospora sp. CUA-673]|uniref:PQQ-dependent sugar dehydrogenase n=1 Tax=Saccharomonospora sp. CUA-673 TaxID=1904969 RepID=UPI000961308F|nr:PQQ-dependent sugar dehydrogenase [Saccharomonospora sp. CUA-673]OLT46254.1 glucose dehydrogenase [Saccharomonospora sp. CUA-673]